MFYTQTVVCFRDLHAITNKKPYTEEMFGSYADTRSRTRTFHCWSFSTSLCLKQPQQVTRPDLNLNSFHRPFTPTLFRTVADEPSGGSLCAHTDLFFGGEPRWGDGRSARAVCAVTLSVTIMWVELGWKNTPHRPFV